MTGSELKIKLCSSKKFLSRFVYADIKTYGAPNGNLELCDCLLEYNNAYIIIQIKEKEKNSQADFSEWFNRKVIKKAKDQIKDSINQFYNEKYIFISGEKQIIIDRNKKISCIIVFDADDTNDDYTKIYTTKSGIEMNIFSIKDFDEMLNNLVLPSDIFDFMAFRKDFYNKFSNGQSPLIIDDVSSEVSLISRIDTDIQISDYYILKRYELIGLEVEKTFKFNWILNTLDSEPCNNEESLKLMLSFNRREAVSFIRLWDNAYEVSRGSKFIMPEVLHDKDNIFVCFGKPINCSEKLFLMNFNLIIKECFDEFDCTKIHMFVFENEGGEQFSVSYQLILK